MNSVLEKLGIYDFMGIWGPGVIATTYFLYSFDPVINGFRSIPTGTIQFVVFYSAIAYCVGVFLHEIGKCLGDFLDVFRPERVKDMDRIMVRPCKINMLKTIQYDYQQAIYANMTEDEYAGIVFEQATSFLKYGRSTETKRIDKYHSIYALSRSLLIMAILHLAATFYCVFVCENTVSEYYILIDIAAILLLHIRTYRFYYMWNKNVYIQYYYLKNEIIGKRKRNCGCSRGKGTQCVKVSVKSTADLR